MIIFVMNNVVYSRTHFLKDATHLWKERCWTKRKKTNFQWNIQPQRQTKNTFCSLFIQILYLFLYIWMKGNGFKFVFNIYKGKGIIQIIFFYIIVMKNKGCISILYKVFNDNLFADNFLKL